MNWKLIIRIIGTLLLIEAGLLGACIGVGLAYDECFLPFLWPTAISCALGLAGLIMSRGASSNMGRKDGYIVVSLAWVSFALIGMLPFLFSGSLPDVASAFFESMSGFTSTGATVIDNCDIQPHSILVWRSLSQWIGGIGIVFFTIAILPAFGVGEVKLFAAEATGPMHDKVHPRISVAVRWIGSVYLLLTCLCITSLWLCGMDFFDAFNYGLVTTGTGGFGTHSALLREVFNSPAIEYVLIFFMFISGVNYTLIYYSILKGRFRRFFRDAELRCYLSIVVFTTLVCTLTLFAYRMEWPALFTFNFHHEPILEVLKNLEDSLRESAFTVISLQTTTGLATCDYTTWPMMLMPVLMFVMFAGACSGSTSGGFKCVRWSIIFRIVRNELRHILHPRAILPVRINGTIIHPQVVRTMLAFVALFVGALFCGAFVLSFFGVSESAPIDAFSFYDAFGISLSSLSNVGPGMGYYGPIHSWSILTPFAKFVCSGLMLVGRLEIFPIIILFSRSFWKKS